MAHHKPAMIKSKMCEINHQLIKLRWTFWQLRIKNCQSTIIIPIQTYYSLPCEKSHQRKSRKGKNNIRTEPITTLNTTEINTLTDPELDVEKKREFSEYWRNEENFYVHHILDDECKRAKTWESCKVDFPKENSEIGSDLVVVHKKRYMRPNVDGFGKRGEPIFTTQLERKFYCVKKKCLLKRHPYF